jgi:hypothetical protein
MIYDSEVVLTARVRPGSRAVELDFGKQVAEVCCSHDEARSFAATVRRLVHSYFGDMTTNTWNQPFRLKAERGNVVVFLPEMRDRMLVNPDVILGLAARLEQTADWGAKRAARA